MGFLSTLKQISSGLGIFAGAITTLYVIWDKLLKPMLIGAGKLKEKNNEKRKEEIREVANAIAEEQETKIDLKLKEIKESIVQVAQINKDQSSYLYDLEKRLDESEIDRLRWEVLSFASNLRDNNSQPTSEDFDHVTDAYAQYEAILVRLDRENGKIELAHTIIDKAYQTRYPNQYINKYPNSDFAKEETKKTAEKI